MASRCLCHCSPAGRPCFCITTLDPLGVCYGFASGPASRTHQLLEHLSDRVVDAATGPRILAGDFNLLEPDNPYEPHWRNCGFVEVQQLWAKTTGQVPQATCKQCTRKDFLYISAELVPFVREVQVQHDWFADHSVLLTHLSLPRVQPARPIWRMPRPRPIPPAVAQAVLQSGASGQDALTADTIDCRCAGIWRAQEARLSEQLARSGLSPLTHAEMGRGSTTDVTILRQDPAPIRKSRAGELEPCYFGLNRRYGLWFRQLRRLQSLSRALRKEVQGHSTVIHRAATWHAILQAPGFPQGFSAWWPTRPHKLLHAPPRISGGLPFPAVLLTHRRKLAKARRAQLPSLIFRDVQRDKACPVSTLVEGPQASVVHIDPGDFSVEVDQERCWSADVPIFVDGSPYKPLHVEADKIWLDRVPPATAKEVRQETHLATLPDLFRAFGEAWAERWLRHSHISPDRWNRALSMTQTPAWIQKVDPPVPWVSWNHLSKSGSPTTVFSKSRSATNVLHHEHHHPNLAKAQRQANFCGIL